MYRSIYMIRYIYLYEAGSAMCNTAIVLYSITCYTCTCFKILICTSVFTVITNNLKEVFTETAVVFISYHFSYFRKYIAKSILYVYDKFVNLTIKKKYLPTFKF